MATSPSAGEAVERCDLVFALVRPIGVPEDKFVKNLSGALAFYGYEVHFVKLSAILDARAEEAGRLTQFSPLDVRIDGLVNEGRLACEEANHAAAVAALGISKIKTLRTSNRPNAFIISSLKRCAEIDLLRDVYGGHVLVIGLQASPGIRRRNLIGRYRIKRATESWAAIASIVDDQIDRDQRESNAGDYGQDVLNAFPMADVFVDAGKGAGRQARRIIDLLFKSPTRPTPTVAELAMTAADAVSARSPELGRRVGAAIVRNGEIVCTGTNAHPQAPGTPEVDSSTYDIHELVGDMLTRISGTEVLGKNLQDRFIPDLNSVVGELLKGPLQQSKVRALTEFQTTVHAEMSALLNALNLGHDVRGGCVYVTDFPCHGCAKHILSLKLNVVYLQPYPKSRAESMYGAPVRRRFKPFTGVAPRRFSQLFQVVEDRKDSDGVVRDPNPADSPNIQYQLRQAELLQRENLGVASVLPEQT